MDIKFYRDLPLSTFEYLGNLRTKNTYIFKPSLGGVTKYGNLITLGFSCFALKIYYMTGEWHRLNKTEKETWINYINSFQSDDSSFPQSSFVDPFFIESYMNLGVKENTKFYIKSLLNMTNKYNFDTKQIALNKAINAETKQAVATLYQVDSRNSKKIDNVYFEGNDPTNYLDNLDWSRPWSSGAQFSSICALSTTQNLGFKKELEEFIGKIANSETGSYFSIYPSSSREVINGAMKVISGLDWIDLPIHNPRKLIDYCLSNQPILEGCDVVDFVYVLYKCAKQTNYRKNEINSLFKELLEEIAKLYINEDNGFSYFIGKSQTHYYGVKITKGLKKADIHGTTLCLWAIIMILDSLEIEDTKYNIIKP